MKVRLAWTLSLWLLGAVALSTLAMGGFTAWHLRLGFVSYLQSRELERLDRFVGLVAARLGRDGVPIQPPPERPGTQRTTRRDGLRRRPSAGA